MARRPQRQYGTANRPDARYPRFYGRHAVLAALANPARVKRKLWLTHEAKSAVEVPHDLAVQYGDGHDLARLIAADAPHQGMVLEVEPLESPWLGDVLADAEGSRHPLLVLDQVTDPHNVGAILRSAAAFEAVAIVTQDRHAPNESGALAKAASGTLEVVPWVRVVNLSRALDEIGEAGFWRIGLAGGVELTLDKALGETRPALVLGAEGEGLRPNTAAHCDELAKLPISSAVESLNVSNAAAIALYAAARRELK
jgi:23S rRNA (guanosine2251-2'-O)-methyltransferase